MKSIRFSLFILLIFSCLIPLGCATRTLYTDATPYAPVTDSPKRVEAQPPQTSVPKPPAPAEPVASLDREKRIREESIREEDLRAKALKEETLRKEAAAKEAALREAAAKEAALRELRFETIYFDYNEWVIRDDQKELMAWNAERLRSNPDINVLLAGNCDERGTAEYNLALGQKRAESARAFLVGLGIDPKRMKTISYGFERPVDPRHNEEAWAKNRRVDFVVIK